MLPIQNELAQTSYLTEESKDFSPEDRDSHVILVLEQVATLRRHFAALAGRALTGPVQLLDASAPEDVLPVVDRRSPAMIVVDMSSSDYGGIMMAAELWAQEPSTKILFWCHSFKEAYLQQLNQIVPPFAVYGIVLKSCPDEKMVHAIQSVMLHDNTFVDSTVRARVGRASRQRNRLTRTEYETLCDVILGLTDKAIAKRRNLSARGVQNRLSALFSKLLKGRHSWLREAAQMDVYNLRTRLVFEVVKSGLVDQDVLDSLDQDLDHWLSDRFGI